MWTRKSVKERGKKAFTLNFWKCVLVALILSIVVGATSNSWGGAFPAFTNGFNNHDVVDTVDDPQDIIDDVSDDEPDFVFNIDTDDLTDEEIAGIIGAIAMIMILCFVVWIVATAIALAVTVALAEFRKELFAQVLEHVAVEPAEREAEASQHLFNRESLVIHVQNGAVLNKDNHFFLIPAQM